MGQNGEVKEERRLTIKNLDLVKSTLVEEGYLKEKNVQRLEEFFEALSGVLIEGVVNPISCDITLTNPETGENHNGAIFQLSKTEEVKRIDGTEYLVKIELARNRSSSKLHQKIYRSLTDKNIPVWEEYGM